MLGKKNLNFATALFLVFWLIKEKLQIYTIPSQTFLSDGAKIKIFFHGPRPSNFLFLEKQEIRFFAKMSTAALYIPVPTPTSQVFHFALIWRPVLSQFYPLVQQSSKNKRKKRGCCEQSSMVYDAIETKSTSLHDTCNTSWFNSHRD